jgi:hypothetical protein
MNWVSSINNAMAKLLDRISAQIRSGGMQTRSAQARDWLSKEVSRATLPSNIRGASILRDNKRKTSRIEPGRMYFYMYDPKTKDSLPYYDKFPLVLPIERYSGGFLGLNFHYIQPNERIMLLDKLYDTLTNTRYDETTKLRVNYNILNSVARFETFKPCLKRYLLSHIRSGIIEVGIDDWETALMLPVENFVYKK